MNECKHCGRPVFTYSGCQGFVCRHPLLRKPPKPLPPLTPLMADAMRRFQLRTQKQRRLWHEVIQEMNR